MTFHALLSVFDLFPGWYTGLPVLACQTERRDSSNRVSSENYQYNTSLHGVRSPPLPWLASDPETRNSYAVVGHAEQ